MELPSDTEIPDCHSNGEQPEGYSPKEETCPQCIYKFTCLPIAVEKGLAESLRLDFEVLAVRNGRMEFATAFDRMEQRAKYIRDKKPIPAELRTNACVDLVSDLLQAAREKEEQAAAAEPDELPRRLTTRDRRRNWAPYPKTISPEQMRHLLSCPDFKKRGVRIGQPFQLEIGMAIVHRKKTREVVVHLRETGFEFNGTMYPTLSAAAIAIERRSVSGNDFFSLQNLGVEIRDASGMVLVRGGKDYSFHAPVADAEPVE